MAPRVTSERPARGGRKKEREIGKEKQTSKWHPLRERVSPTHHAREHSHSTDTAWTQHRHGTDTAQTRHRHSTDTVQTQHRHGTGTAQAQHSQSTVTATAQSPHCPYSSATTALKDPVDLNGAAGEVGGHIGISARHDTTRLQHLFRRRERAPPNVVCRVLHKNCPCFSRADESHKRRSTAFQRAVKEHHRPCVEGAVRPSVLVADRVAPV